MLEGKTKIVGTFMGVPHSQDISKSKAAILGIPFDCGLHPDRVGARLGPSAIRQQSVLVRPYQPPIWDTNLLDELRVVDCGDVDVVLGDLPETFDRITESLGVLLDGDVTPITFGGDGSVTLPQLRAFQKKYPDLVVLHFDAHTDTYPDVDDFGQPGSNMRDFNPATTFTRAAEEGLVDTENSIHIGARGSISVPGVFEFTKSKGFELITGSDLNQQGIEETLAHVHERLQGRPVYLCWDMDFFDPSCAPGVFTPTWGGATAREGLALLQGLSGLNIVGTDINTLSPLYDVGGMSAFLAATCVLECLALVAVQRRLA